ncbi:MAG: D-alanine--D-alanine ligase, partial [Patescibacteria group bacterium]
PAPVRPSVRENVKRASRRIHETLGCDGLTRSDFILAPGGKLYFLEINTIPGMTPASLCPKEAAALGWSFGEFLDKIIALAIEKRR